jgi:hypothetical protein
MRQFLLILLTFLCFLPQLPQAATAHFPAKASHILAPQNEKIASPKSNGFIGLVKEVVVKHFAKIRALSIKTFTLIASILSVFVLGVCVYFAIKITKNADLGKSKPYITAVLALLYALLYVAILGILTDNLFKKKVEKAK